jgi:hypothetical protein
MEGSSSRQPCARRSSGGARMQLVCPET